MPKEKVIEGDILLFTLENNKYSLAKILFASKVFKNVILLGIYGKIIDEKQMPNDLPNSYVDTIYTSSKRITEFGWEKIGNISVSESDKALTERNVGGEIYIEDKFIRIENENDAHIPYMGVYGFVALERKIKKIFRIEENSKP